MEEQIDREFFCLSKKKGGWLLPIIYFQFRDSSSTDDDEPKGLAGHVN